MTVAELIDRLRELEPGRLVVIQDVGGCCAYPLHSWEPVRYEEQGGPIGEVVDDGGEPAALLIPE